MQEPISDFLRKVDHHCSTWTGSCKDPQVSLRRETPLISALASRTPHNLPFERPMRSGDRNLGFQLINDHAIAVLEVSPVVWHVR